MSKEKQQTAVEWLIDKLTSQSIDNINDEYWFGIIGQAKEMEKQQIMYAHITGLVHPLETSASKQAEEYYNETFGK